MTVRRPLILSLIVASMPAHAFLQPVAQAQPSDAVAHTLLVGGFETLARIDKEKKVIWSAKMSPEIYDAWQLPNGHILFNHTWGVEEIDRSGKVVWTYGDPGVEKKIEEMLSCQPLPNGNVLILEAGKNRLIEVDRKKRIRFQVPLPATTTKIHNRYTLARKTPKGTYLVSLRDDQAIAELDRKGKTLWQMPLGLRPWSLVRLPNGNTLVTAFFTEEERKGQSRMFELDRKQKVVWEVTSADVPQVKRFWPTGVHRLKNGNTIVLNTDFHYETPGDDAIQAFEITRDKKIVWTLTAEDIGAQLPRTTDHRTKLQEYRLLSIQVLEEKKPASQLLR